MNNSLNIQPVSFGMAHKIKDVEKFRVALNRLTTQEKVKLANEIAEANKALEKTRYADVFTYVEKDFGKIRHYCHVKEPVMNEDGNIITKVSHDYAEMTLPEAVKTALREEDCKIADEHSLKMFEYIA